jgi:hypothetical protein
LYTFFSIVISQTKLLVSTTFSALFCKLWRLNKVFASAARFRKINVQVKDVLYPFVILLTLNFTLLTVWTVVDPLRWVRQDLDSTDVFGRATESFGSCSSESKTNEIIFNTFFCLFNFSALAVANWQSYQARNLQTEFNESSNITMSMFFMTEAALLGLPVLYLTEINPAAHFLVRALLIVIMSFAVLISIFLPKVALRNKLKLDATRSIKFVEKEKEEDVKVARIRPQRRISLVDTVLSQKLNTARAIKFVAEEEEGVQVARIRLQRRISFVDTILPQELDTTRAIKFVAEEEEDAQVARKRPQRRISFVDTVLPQELDTTRAIKFDAEEEEDAQVARIRPQRRISFVDTVLPQELDTARAIKFVAEEEEGVQVARRRPQRRISFVDTILP